MKDKNGNQNCNGCKDCHNSTGCHNSTWCYNSTGCHNCAYCLYCDGLVLEKYHIFNKPISKEEYETIKNKIQSKLGYWKRPEQLTEKDKAWLKENVQQFDKKVLKAIIDKSITPDKPKSIEKEEK